LTACRDRREILTGRFSVQTIILAFNRGFRRWSDRLDISDTYCSLRRHTADSAAMIFQDRLRLFRSAAGNVLRLSWDGFQYLVLFLRSGAAVRAELLMLKKQVALCKEREIPFSRATNATRLALAFLAKLTPLWRDCLFIVKPETVVRWHRHAARLFWRRRCRGGGRPTIPFDTRELIRKLARENPRWGEERIQSEMLTKFGIVLSPRTVRKYMPKTEGSPRGDQRWATFVRNHVKVMLACDFMTVWTVGFTTLYVFVVMEIGSRRILHFNVTSGPTAAWTEQQLRQAIPSDHGYRFLIHDRDTIFSVDVDRSVKNMGVKVLKTPIRSPQANSFLERLNGTIRRECLDFLIPLGEKHLRTLLAEWVEHYNRGRPHASLGPGIPDPPQGLPAPLAENRHEIPEDHRVVAKPILGGLHHEYRLEKIAA